MARVKIDDDRYINENNEVFIVSLATIEIEKLKEEILFIKRDIVDVPQGLEEHAQFILMNSNDMLQGEILYKQRQIDLFLSKMKAINESL